MCVVFPNTLFYKYTPYVCVYVCACYVNAFSCLCVFTLCLRSPRQPCPDQSVSLFQANDPDFREVRHVGIQLVLQVV